MNKVHLRVSAIQCSFHLTDFILWNLKLMPRSGLFTHTHSWPEEKPGMQPQLLVPVSSLVQGKEMRCPNLPSRMDLLPSVGCGVSRESPTSLAGSPKLTEEWTDVLDK